MESSRRLERARVLELLYEADAKGIGVDELFADLPTHPEPFVREFVEGVAALVDELDGEITKRLINWDFDRVALVDKIILRMGVWELLYRLETPIAVVISEAVELAKEFSTEESGKFVNGVLGSFQNER